MGPLALVLKTKGMVAMGIGPTGLWLEDQGPMGLGPSDVGGPGPFIGGCPWARVTWAPGPAHGIRFRRHIRTAGHSQHNQ